MESYSHDPLNAAGQQAAVTTQPDSVDEQLQTRACRLEILPCEIRIPEAERSTIERHRDDIAVLTENLNQLLASPKYRLSVNPGASVFSSKELNAPPTKPDGQAPGFSQTSMPALPFLFRSYPACPEIFSSFFPLKLRMSADRSLHHINYPVIPRWRDRARLRRIQARSSSLLPQDLPPWSGRAQAPTVSQPDWSDNGRFLVYDGFSMDLYFAYSKALEEYRVPLIPVPYCDEDMKRVLVEKHVLTEKIAEDKVVKGSREHWQEPIECREDEKHWKEMREIEERGNY